MVLATAIFMQMLDSTILNTTLKSIAEDLGESPLHMHNAIISYVLTLAIFMPVSGYLADRFGTRKVFIFSVALFSVGSLLCSMANSLNTLVLARIVQGMGGALMMPVGRLALMKTFSKNELLRALNYAVVPAMIGPVLGPLVGGYMVDYLSWHWIFLINIPIGILGVVLGARHMPDYRAPGSTLDVKGFLLFGAASLLITISIEMLSNSKNIIPVLGIFLTGTAILYIYYRYAKRAEHAIFPLNLFQIRTFRVGILGNLVTRLGISAVPLLLPLMIQLAYGKSAVVSGWIVAPMALTAMFGKSAVIRILDKLGYRNTLRINSTILGILIMMIALPGPDTNIIWFIPILATMGFFNSIQFTSMNSISMADLRENMASSGNSLIAVNQQLAIGFGIAFGLLVLKFFQQNAVVNDSSVHSAFRHSFIVLGVLTIITGNYFRRLHRFDGNNMRSGDV